MDDLTMQLLDRLYAAFNVRDIDAALATMHPEVVWPNGMEGGTMNGHDSVRAYWTRQWMQIDPHVEAVHHAREADGRIAVEVRAIVRDLAGTVLLEQTIQHVYEVHGGLITSMEIRPAKALRTSE